MSTIDHRHHLPGTTSGGHDDPASGAKVVSLDGLRRRRRLDRLEATRSHLASMAAQQRSHGLDDADETFSLQLGVEQTIRDEFPAEYEELFVRWLEQDPTLEHPAGVLQAECGICRSIARAGGINLMPPDAA